MAAAAKIVFLTGNEINSHTAAGIEVGDILFFIGVDGNKDTFCVCLTFKNTLLVGQKDTAEISLVQSLRILLCKSQPAKFTEDAA